MKEARSGRLSKGIVRLVLYERGMAGDFRVVAHPDHRCFYYFLRVLSKAYVFNSVDQSMFLELNESLGAGRGRPGSSMRRAWDFPYSHTPWITGVPSCFEVNIT